MLYIGEGSVVTMFDLIGFAKKHLRGQHFCALRARFESGYIHFEPCEYAGPLPEKELPNWVKIIGSSDESLCVFEHFLQSVRKKFPGIPFDQIRIEASLNWQRSWVEPNRSPFFI